MQFLGGVGSGTFIPLTISFIVRSLPARLVVYGIAVYAMNSELSQNVAASLEGWYSDNLSWRWIDWQYCVALPLMFACIWYGVPREKINTALAARPRLARARLCRRSASRCSTPASTRATGSTGPTTVWSIGLLLSGGLAHARLRRARADHAAAVPEPAAARAAEPVPLLLLLAGFRFIILSTAYIIPTYLQMVQNFRELQVGAVLLWIALPQLVIVLPLGWLLQRVDAPLGAGARRDADRRRLPDGDRPDQRSGRPTISCPRRSCRRSASPSR